MYLRHLNRVYNTPLLIQPQAFHAFLPTLTRVLIGEPLPEQSYGPLPSLEPYRVGDAGVIPIYGILTHRGEYDAQSHLFLGYTHIIRNIQRAIDDAAVSRIVLDIDSPGGEANGAFNAMGKIRELSQHKPITAVVNEFAHSAAYGIAAAANEITISETGMCGSVGVLLEHANIEGWLRSEGIELTQLYVGERKIDGSSFVPLSDEATERFMRDLTGLYDTFVSLVARHRGISETIVRDTQAATYQGMAAVDIGFADRIASLSTVLENVPMTISVPSVPLSEPIDEAPETPTQSPDSPDASVTVDSSREYAAGVEQGMKTAAVRIASILGSEQAKGREELAQHLALKTLLAAEDAIGILAASPLMSAGHEDTPLDRAMAAVGDSGVSSFPGDGQAQMTRDEFEALSPKDRRAFLRQQGKIVD